MKLAKIVTLAMIIATVNLFVPEVSVAQQKQVAKPTTTKPVVKPVTKPVATPATNTPTPKEDNSSPIGPIKIKGAYGVGGDFRKGVVLSAGIYVAPEDEESKFPLMRLLGTFSFPTTSFGVDFAISPFHKKVAKIVQFGCEFDYIYESNFSLQSYFHQLASSSKAFSDPYGRWDTKILVCSPFVGIHIPIGSCAIELQGHPFPWGAWLFDGQEFGEPKQWFTFQGHFIYIPKWNK